MNVTSLQLLALAFLLLLAACPSDKDGATKPANSSAIPTAAASERPAAPSASAPKGKGGSFRDDEHGFELALPAPWEIITDDADAKGSAARSKLDRALLSARLVQGATRSRLVARFAPGKKPADYLDAYLKVVKASLADSNSLKQSSRAKVVMGGRPFTTQRLKMDGGKTRQLLFVTKSKGGALLLAFTAGSAAELNRFGRLFQKLTFGKKSR